MAGPPRLDRRPASSATAASLAAALLPPLLLLLLACVAPCQGCPPRCECAAQLRSVSCQRRRLSGVPDGIPTETRLLDLSRNRLRWVASGELAPYPLLEELDLSENLIATLEPNAFASLQSLRTLRLRANQLKLVPMGAFAKLGNLTTLDLSENKIVILLDYTFQDLRSLRNLEVGGGRWCGGSSGCGGGEDGINGTGQMEWLHGWMDICLGRGMAIRTGEEIIDG